jgi:trehalose 6-phosphate phosphatase
VRRDKGDVVRKVIAASSPDAVLVAGDDLGDLPAFAAAEAAAASGLKALRVAVRSDETPPDLLAQADLAVDGPSGLRAYLESLLT